MFEHVRQTTLLSDPPPNEPWCLIDLLGRTAVIEMWSETPRLRGAYEADEEDRAEGFPIVWHDTPEDWLFCRASADWRADVEARASARAAIPRVDARAVLYGPPLLEHLADGVLAASARDREETDEQERTRLIHAGWLMTARADLGGRTPREWLLAHRGRLAFDMEHRVEQWSRQGHAPTPLSPDSTAYRLGGFGTTEVVMYFDLVRALLAEAWELAGQEPRPTKELLVQTLSEIRTVWLNQPNAEIGMPLTPGELIEMERRRMPVASDGSHLFDDCPICQAEADGAFGFGPAFMSIDGCHLELEDEFAFSLCETREEWDRQQEDDRRMSEEIDRKQRERAARGEDAEGGDDPVWRTSHIDWDGLADRGGNPRTALAFPLAELVGELQRRPDGADLHEALNRAYGELRRSQDAVGEDSAAQGLRDALEAVCAKFADLTPRCADLQGRLDEVLRLPF